MNWEMDSRSAGASRLKNASCSTQRVAMLQQVSLKRTAILCSFLIPYELSQTTQTSSSCLQRKIKQVA